MPWNTPPGQHPELYTTADGHAFDPATFAAAFVQGTIPGIAFSAPHGMHLAPAFVYGPADPSPLVAETHELAPPAQIPAAGDLYGVLIGIVALRAATPSFEPGETNVARRYDRARGWLCDNFREIIWWNCDNK